MIKDVIVNLTPAAPGVTRDVAGDYAISIAEAFGAHVSGVAFAYDPILPASIMGGISADIFDSQRRENEAAAKVTIDQFQAAAKRAGVSAETRLMTATVGAAADTFASLARRFDLSVVPQVTPDTIAPDELLMEAALFESGRPMLVVPYIQRAPLNLDRVICCWDGSRTAARAIGDAMPFLTKAKAVDLVIVGKGKMNEKELTGADMGAHLARHGMKVEVKNIPAADIDVANVVLSYAADCGAQLIVMGGFGHSRLREYILGGATRGILASMTVPVLMSH
jgi:nucleotide-binding universal stress UspA family protein